MPDTPAVPLTQWLDGLLSESVESATERARTAFDREVAPYGKRFVLMGSGNIGRRILARLRQDGIEPLAFSDNQQSQWRKSIDGLEVLPPAEAAARYGRDSVFIVSIYNHNHSFPQTRDQMTGLGCSKVLSVIPLRWKYSETFLPYFRDDLPQKVLAQTDAVREAFNAWTDESSRREYVAQVAWRLNGEFDVLGPPVPDEYFPRDIIRLSTDEFFVDVGAYDGDTVRKFLYHRSGQVRGILALEPDTRNFARLVDYVNGLPADLTGKIVPKPLAASDRACRLRFSDGAGTSSALSEQGSVEVECVRLDDLLTGLRPTYIKMDIEGAELDAIAGCTRVLSEERPIVAACVYHVQDHLWKIPNSLRRLNPGYRFFLRPHMVECWETVCYAVPPERRQ